MKPLASPVVEYRLMGIAQLVSGFALGIVGLVVQEPTGAVIEFLVIGVLFGAWMYAVAYGRHARRAVRTVAAPSTTQRETPMRTYRRVALTTAWLLAVFVAVGGLLDWLAPLGGFAAGNGAAFLMTSRWLGMWERDHRGHLLREPRWRGIVDPRDFYVTQ